MKMHSKIRVLALSVTLLFSVTVFAGQKDDQTRKERKEAKRQERENKKEAKAQRIAHL
jgi:hypothetical protein